MAHILFTVPTALSASPFTLTYVGELITCKKSYSDTNLLDSLDANWVPLSDINTSQILHVKNISLMTSMVACEPCEESFLTSIQCLKQSTTNRKVLLLKVNSPAPRLFRSSVDG